MRMKFSARRGRGKSAYTLVELTLAILVGLAIAGALMVLVNQQFAFLRLYRTQNFLADEAPLINNQLTRILGQADRFRVHRNLADAVSGTNPVLQDGSAVALVFRQPDGTQHAAILSFEQRGTGSGLYYYPLPAAGTVGNPDWAVTKRPTNVTFHVEEGILRVRLTGPSGEEITYSGAMQL